MVITSAALSFLLYGGLLQKYNEIVSSHILSMLHCWIFVYTENINTLLGYYLYDTIRSIAKKDLLMILHHLFTGIFLLHGVNASPNDMTKIYFGTLWLKYSDMFLHHYKIIEYAGWTNQAPIFWRMYQIFTVLLTMYRWAVYRLIFPISMFWFDSMLNNIMALSFYIMSWLWMVKLFKLAKKIIYDLANLLLID